MQSRKTKIEQSIKENSYLKIVGNILGALYKRNEQALESIKQNNKQINSLKTDFEWIQKKYKIIKK